MNTQRKSLLLGAGLVLVAVAALFAKRSEVEKWNGPGSMNSTSDA